MVVIGSVLENRVLWAALLGWLAAQVAKVVVILIKEKKLRIRRLFGAGGMPSSHTAFVSALTTGVGMMEGFHSPEFALAAVFCLVVMYDATGVRRAAGEHAKQLNRMSDIVQDILEATLERGEPLDEKKLKELIGHTPVEVIAGAAVGIATAVAFLYKFRMM
ncbi:MAG: divergent PAP2 family protein [Oscillospiraceae bacterium]|jgi:acid phosphatase family membrane protein YuiD|nr:divergent PAP2 family protein [Oscillospiraceae bacterium]